MKYINIKVSVFKGQKILKSEELRQLPSKFRKQSRGYYDLSRMNLSDHGIR
jgi:hypothetical protein